MNEPTVEMEDPGLPDPAEPAILDFSGSHRITPPPASPPDSEDERPQHAEPAAPPAPTEAAARTAQALGERLVPVSFADRAFLLPDAAMAGRFALETIRAAHRLAGRPKRVRMLYCAGAGTPLPAGFEADAAIDILRSDDLGAIVAAITPKTAALAIAPVRLEPRLEVISGGLLAGLREAADEYGISLVYDETHAGLARTGMMWAHEWTGAAPDLLIAGEGLAGDEPLALVLATQKLARAAAPAPPLDPAVIAAAHARLDVILADGFEGEVQSRAWALEDRLAMLAYQHREVFQEHIGLGLMQGLVCTGDAGELAARAAGEGLLTRALGPVLALLPELTVTEAEIDAAAGILARIAR